MKKGLRRFPDSEVPLSQSMKALPDEEGIETEPFPIFPTLGV